MPIGQQLEFYLTFAANKFDDAGDLIDLITKNHITRIWDVLTQEVEIRQSANAGPSPDH